jgi:hypothetical protein
MSRLLRNSERSLQSLICADIPWTFFRDRFGQEPSSRQIILQKIEPKRPQKPPLTASAGTWNLPGVRLKWLGVVWAAIIAMCTLNAIRKLKFSYVQTAFCGSELL